MALRLRAAHPRFQALATGVSHLCSEWYVQYLAVTARLPKAQALTENLELQSGTSQVFKVSMRSAISPKVLSDVHFSTMPPSNEPL